VLKLRKSPPLIDFARMAWRRFGEERCLQIASSLTFTALLAIVPVITVALTMISAFPVYGELMQHVERFLVANMLPESAASIVAYKDNFADNAARLTAVGILFLFVTAMIVLQTIDRALNQIWRVPRPRSTVQRIVIYWVLLTVGPILIGASLSLTSWLVSQSLGLVKDLPRAGEALLTLVPILLTGCAFALLYITMPNRRVPVRDALSGGFLAALAFEGMKHAFALYITHFPTYKVVYGAFASVPIFSCGFISRGWWCCSVRWWRRYCPNGASAPRRSNPFPARSSSMRCRSCGYCGRLTASGTSFPCHACTPS